MKEKITRRYLAGLLDGEGYFGILKKHEGSSPDGYYYRPVIKMSLTHSEVIKEVCLKLGGHIHKHTFNNDVWKDAWQWESRTFVQVDKVLSYVHEYLIIKKQQADVLREFLETKFKTDNLGSTPMPKELLEKRAYLYYLMKKLNHRGKALAETKRDGSTKVDEVIVRTDMKVSDVVGNYGTAQ
jgi:hypothetical protein